MTEPLLNERPVLDKGYVALASTSLGNVLFNHFLKTHFKNQFDSRITDMCHVITRVKCPLFVQMTFSEFGLVAVSDKSVTTVEAYIPSVSEVCAQDLEASTAIQADIEQTTQALLINPRAYQSENCDAFISQVISPVSVYNTLLVHGSLTSWLRYIDQRSLPKPIEAYRKAVEECLHGEWDRVIQDLRNQRNVKKR